MANNLQSDKFFEVRVLSPKLQSTLHAQKRNYQLGQNTSNKFLEQLQNIYLFNLPGANNINFIMTNLTNGFSLFSTINYGTSGFGSSGRFSESACGSDRDERGRAW
ncbi:MAG: hypothetical protein N2558_03405 [Patescibacteria group bacterium]|nr:hypothetical protein [Patescibacteria group bacterium]